MIWPDGQEFGRGKVQDLVTRKFRRKIYALTSVAQLVGESPIKQKLTELITDQGHMPRLQVWSLVGTHVRSN